MKKLFVLLTSCLLLLTLALTGCSTAVTLSFKNNFTGGAEPKENYLEKLTYEVSYDADGKAYNDLNKSSSNSQYITAEGIKYEGTLVTTLKVEYKDNVSFAGSEILTEANAIFSQIKEVYSFETQLNLTASYKFVNGTEKTVNESIFTKVYFLPAGLSFAPVYSTYVADMNLLSLTPTTPDKLVPVHYEYKTTYNLENYVIEKTVLEDGKQKPTEPYTGEYTFKTIIDNNQLIFALRNFETTSDGSDKLEVLAPAYNEYKSLSISSHSLSNDLIGFEPYKGSSATIPTRTFNACVSEQNSRGANHYFTVQTGASTDGAVKNNALLTKFAQPLFDYGTMSCLGAMVFNLVNVEIVNA